MGKVTIYTDGACSGNPGRGGWGALLEYSGKSREIYGGEGNTTNNRMEMRAAIEALRALKFPCDIVLYTDSSYLKDGITSWIEGWKRNGWKTSARKPVKNVDLWQELDELRAAHNIEWKWVKGHAGNPGNERADELARMGIEQ